MVLSTDSNDTFVIFFLLSCNLMKFCLILKQMEISIHNNFKYIFTILLTNFYLFWNQTKLSNDFNHWQTKITMLKITENELKK